MEAAVAVPASAKTDIKKSTQECFMRAAPLNPSMDKWGLTANTFKNFKSGSFEVAIAALRIGTRRPDRGHRSPSLRGRRTPAFERFRTNRGRKTGMGKCQWGLFDETGYIGCNRFGFRNRPLIGVSFGSWRPPPLRPERIGVYRCLRAHFCSNLPTPTGRWRR